MSTMSRSDHGRRLRGLSSCGCCDWIFSLGRLASHKDSRRDGGRSDDATRRVCDLTREQVDDEGCDCWFCKGDPDPWA